MYTMKQVCNQLNMTYETIRFYCDEGLVPNMTRDKNNYRIFDERDISWLKGVQCLKRCGMSIKDIKSYMSLCQQGPSTIRERKSILGAQKKMIIQQMEELQKSIDFIDSKQTFYDEVLAGNIPYVSNLIGIE